MPEGEDFWLPTDEEFALMSDEEIIEWEALADQHRRAADLEWVAQPKQELATELAHRATELLFGGARGGGKTEWLLRHALDEALNHDNNRIALFRRVFPALERTLIPRSRMFYPQHGGKWNDNKHTWTFPNGSIIELASLQYDQTADDYRGAEYGMLGFEEITEFSESQINLMIGALRAPAPGIRPHLVATTNPGGKGHRWVKRRWVKPKDVDYVGRRPVPFEVWRPAATPENPHPNLRVFVPATLKDNPALIARDPEYINRIRALAGTDKALLKAWEDGDWDAIDAIEGALWIQSDLDAGRVIQGYVEKMVGSLERVVSVDPSDGNEDGKGDSYGVSVAARGMDGIGYVEFVAGWRAAPLQMAKNTIALYNSTRADAIVVERNHGGKWVKTVLHQVDPYANVVEVWASEGKVTRARPVAALFSPIDGTELSSRYRARLAGHFEEFEDQATTYTGQPGEASPNELDAVVWALTYLMLKGRLMDSGAEYQDERLHGRR